MEPSYSRRTAESRSAGADPHRGATGSGGRADTGAGARPISIRYTLLVLLLLALALTTLSAIAFEVSEQGSATDLRGNLFNFLSVDQEAMLPSWYGSSLWFIAAMLALLMVFAAARRRTSWALFCLLCLYFSLDESAVVHEKLNDPGSQLAANMGIETEFSWLLLAALPVLVIVGVLLRHVWGLPVLQRVLIIAAGLVFLGGAVGFEILGGAVWNPNDYTWEYYRFALAEEFLEMAGVSLLIAALLSLVWVNRRDGTVIVRPDGSPPVA